MNVLLSPLGIYICLMYGIQSYSVFVQWPCPKNCLLVCSMHSALACKKSGLPCGTCIPMLIFPLPTCSFRSSDIRLHPRVTTVHTLLLKSYWTITSCCVIFSPFFEFFRMQVRMAVQQAACKSISKWTTCAPGF